MTQDVHKKFNAMLLLYHDPTTNNTAY